MTQTETVSGQCTIICSDISVCLHALITDTSPRRALWPRLYSSAQSYTGGQSVLYCDHTVPLLTPTLLIFIRKHSPNKTYTLISLSIYSVTYVIQAVLNVVTLVLKRKNTRWRNVCLLDIYLYLLLKCAKITCREIATFSLFTRSCEQICDILWGAY